MKTMWDRLKHACEQAVPPITLGKELADRIGVSASAVYQWEGKDVDLKGSVLVALERTLGVRGEWILQGRLPMRISSNPLEGHAIIRFFRDGKVGAGAALNNDSPFARIGGIAFLEESLKRQGIQPETSWAIRVHGPSMQPRINDGDTIVYDTADTKIVNGHIYVIEHPVTEGALVKRLFREIDGRIRIVSDNPDPRYAPETVPADAPGFKVLGRVRWVGSWED